MYNNTSQKQSTPTAIACRQFVKSPLILCAIIAYTVYAVICAIVGIEAIGALDDAFKLFEVSFLLGVAVVTALLMFIAPIVITCGLWKMYNSEGKLGADIVRAGINTYYGMSICLFTCALIGALSQKNSDDSVGEVLLVVAYVSFSLVAIASLRNFADAVQSGSRGGSACTDDVFKSGILMAVYLVLTLIIFGDVIDGLGVLNSSLIELSVIARLVALLLFCISAFVYRETMNSAKAEDRKVSASAATGWRCSCGRTNPDYCRTCVCGASKPVGSIKQEAPAATQPTEQETEEKVSASDDTNQEASTEAQSMEQKVEQERTVRDYIFCSECGEKCPGQAKFCRNCGSKII